MSRPEAVPGPTLTLDRAALRVAPGLRATDATLELHLRASRGAQHEITLPEGAVKEMTLELKRESESKIEDDP